MRMLFSNFLFIGVVRHLLIKPVNLRKSHMSSSLRNFENSDGLTEFLSKLFTSEIPNIVSVHVTGGGAQLISFICTTPGASRSLMEATVPYNQCALDKFLDAKVESSYCSNQVALDMAYKARQNAAKLYLADKQSFSELGLGNIVGLSVTAALISGAPKRGAHRCFIGCSTSKSTFTLSADLIKGSRNRVQEDYVCTRIALEALAEACQLEILTRDYLVTKDLNENLSVPEG